MLPNFSKKYELWLIQNEHSSVFLLHVYMAKREGVAYSVIVRAVYLAFERSVSYILIGENSVQAMPRADQMSSKMSILRGCKTMVLDSLAASHTVTFGATSRRTIELDCFFVCVSFCCCISRVMDMKASQYGLSVRRPCTLRLRAMKELRQWEGINARPIADSCQATERKMAFMETLGHSSSSITRKEQSIATRLVKEALREMSLLEWPFSKENQNFVQQYLLTMAYSKFGFEPLHTFYLCTSRLLKECISTHLRSDGIAIRPGRIVNRRRPLSRIRTSTYVPWAQYQLW